MRSLLVAVLLSMSATAAAVPMTLSHQGRLYDQLGVPLSAPSDVTFRLYDAPSGGSPVWEETIADVQFDSGYFEAILGDVTGLETADFEGDELYLALMVGTSPELPTRVRVASVPFAVRAAVAADLDAGVVIDAAEIRVNGDTIIDADGNVAGSSDTLAELPCTTGQIARYDGANWACATEGYTHQHDAGDITGKLAVERLPVGTGSTDVAAGDHSHPDPAWATITGIPSDIADGDDVLTEAEVEGFITNDELGAMTVESLTVTDGAITFDPTGTIARAAITGMCAGMVSAYGYGSMKVVKSNGVSCNSACDAQDTGTGNPYSNFHCYGSVSADAITSTDKSANEVVGGGWYGNGYCGGTNGMSTYCCCKSNYVNTK